jgi:hypothetical protein
LNHSNAVEGPGASDDAGEEAAALPRIGSVRLPNLLLNRTILRTGLRNEGLIELSTLEDACAIEGPVLNDNGPVSDVS